MAAGTATVLAGLALSSPAFSTGGTIPTRYTCDGKGVSPPLRWTAPPAGTRSMTLLVADPDAPSGLFVHWHVTGIPPKAGSIAEGRRFPHEGLNDAGGRGWTAPCPPRGTSHTYLFVLTALNAHGRSIGEADLILHYRRR
jgi:Raf kinase inhibitor-like YbhB/YbcL family protein